MSSTVLPLESIGTTDPRRRKGVERHQTGAWARWTLALTLGSIALGFAERAPAQSVSPAQRAGSPPGFQEAALEPPPDLQGAFVAAYVLADQPFSAYYRPSTKRAYNAAEGSIAISRHAIGSYTVVFEQLSTSPGSVHATTVGSDAICSVSAWGGDRTRVRCFTPQGRPIDSEFTVTVIVPWSTVKQPGLESQAAIVAYASATQPKVERYEPTSELAYNATGRPIEARRSAPGEYSIRFSGLHLDRGAVHVTAEGHDERCAVLQWEGDTIRVNCYDTEGQPTDARYTVQGIVAGDARGAAIMAYAWANEANDERYPPMAHYALNSAGGKVQGLRNERGLYSMSFERMGLAGGSVMLSGYGESPRHCTLTSWSADRVNVSCFDPKGQPADSQYVVALVQAPQADAGSQQPPTRTLRLWRSANGDHLSIASEASERRARSRGYRPIRTQGRVLASQARGTIPLTLWYHTRKNRSITTASPRGERIARNRGYSRVYVEGHCYRTQQPQTLPLLLWHHPTSEELFVTTTPEGEQPASRDGRSGSIECYLPTR